MEGSCVTGLSVIIPSRTVSNFLACAEAVRKAESAVRLIVVDDGLGNAWLPRPELMPAVRVKGAKPFVFARNVNAGIRLAEDDDVVLLNDDALLRTPGGFSAMQAAAWRYGDFGVVSAAVTGPSNSVEHAPRGIFGIRAIHGRMIPFVAVLIPRWVIEQVGLLDECFTDYGGEDDSYCYRVRHAGLKIGVYDACLVDHGVLPSTYRPDGKGRSIEIARRQFHELQGFEMGTR